MSDPPNTRTQLPTPRDPNLMKEGRLDSSDIFWRDLQPWLKEKGYALRKRYHPGWVASWLRSPQPDKDWYDYEDGTLRQIGTVMDAIRADGTLVAIKRIKLSKSPDEPLIGKLFSSEPLASHPTNHCVPFLEILQVPDDEDATLLVMPLLYPNENPPFETIGEVVDFFRQIFEGLQFMHKNNVAHGDCKYDNIMSNVALLYDFPPHPWRQEMRHDFTGKVKQVATRTRVPLKYYLVDFGLSHVYLPEDAPHLEHPPWGGDRSVPEFLTPGNAPCDPFPVDVYCIGNCIRENFTEGDDRLSAIPKKGFEFMHGLVADMVQDDPKKRLTMDQVVSRFEEITTQLGTWKLRSRVVNVDERPLRGAFRSARHWIKQLGLIARRIPATPNA